MKKAFSLSEVLITLVIIGIVAALTIPNLIKKWEDQETVAAVKKTYSLFDNAFKLILREDNVADLRDIDWPYKPSYYGHENPDYLLLRLSQHIKMEKLCYSNSNCLPTWKSKYNALFYKYLNNNLLYNSNTYDTPAIYGKAILSNGTTMSISVHDSAGVDINRTDGYIGNIRFDINGAKGPNRLGYDVFTFYFSKNGLTLTAQGNGPSSCNKNTNSGVGCANWIIKHGNVDYKYRDVSKEW